MSHNVKILRCYEDFFMKAYLIKYIRSNATSLHATKSHGNVKIWVLYFKIIL